MDRFTFIKLFGLGTMGVASAHPFLDKLGELPEEEVLMPVLFIGHGAPTNVLEENAFTKDLKKLGQSIQKPKAILVVSAHWLTKGTQICHAEKPKMIYDFSGFPEKMYQIEYNCPGSPEFAKQAQSLLTEVRPKLDDEWGLDHGAWTVLYHMYPEADIPVFELSIDFHKNEQYHFEIGAYLKALRKKGVLIMGSGNLTHNLGHAMRSDGKTTPDWALEFDTKIKTYVDKGDFASVVNYKSLGNVAKMAHPSNDHFLPLLYTLGAANSNEKVTYPHESFQYGSLSMRCIRIG